MRRWTSTVLALIAAFAVATAPAASAAEPTDVRVLVWNIWLGGTGAGEDNLPLLLDQVVDIAPDVFLAVETYGSGELIRDALSSRAGKGEYHAVRITATERDNLWIFTRYPVVEVYPKPTGGGPVGADLTDFHLGGIRVALPDGRELNLVDVWSTYTDPWVGYLIDENAAGIRAGLEPRHTVAEVEAADRIQTAYVTDMVRTQLPAMLGGNTDPVLMGGDLNTNPAADWTAEWSECPNHFGMSYDLAATDVITGAGFVDTYRAAHPDVCTDPGRTWSPQPTEQLITPSRIDFLFARGAVEVGASTVVDERLPTHPDGAFYSDHAAVVTDVVVD